MLSVTTVVGVMKVICPDHVENRATIFGQVAGQTCILPMSRVDCPKNKNKTKTGIGSLGVHRHL